jgi:hypothetical protein
MNKVTTSSKNYFGKALDGCPMDGGNLTVDFNGEFLETV